ncbi:MAG: GNAT family N-acetyltransferase [Byssovorax sp.]
MILRDATPDDFSAILALNEEFVAVLSPLSPERLAYLHSAAALHRVIEDDGAILAFLLAFREGAAYDSPNYRWFSRQFERFLYVDRVVVARGGRAMGLGTRLYHDLFAWAARASISTITCEFNADPPNTESQRFHAKLGFREVGRQRVAEDEHLVSLQAVSIALDAQGAS